MGQPKSGVSAPKNKRLSLIDRISLKNNGTLYTPPVSEPSPLSRQLQSAVQSAPQKNNEVKPAAKTVAKPAKATKPAAKKAKAAPDNVLEKSVKDYASYKKAKDMGTFKGTFKNWTEHNS